LTIPKIRIRKRLANCFASLFGVDLRRATRELGRVHVLMKCFLT